jgi:hypothetical protein
MRFVPAYIKLEFDEYNEKYKEEFDRLGSESEDPIGQYIKLAKARGETRDTDPVLLELMVALHRKMDELISLVKNEKKEFLPLKYKTETEGLGFEYFKIKEPLLEKGKKYYGRFDLPVFPERKVPVIFEGYDKDIGHILLMHEKDEKDYNAYITARERALIREMKRNG